MSALEVLDLSLHQVHTSNLVQGVSSVGVSYRCDTDDKYCTFTGPGTKELPSSRGLPV